VRIGNGHARIVRISVCGQGSYPAPMRRFRLPARACRSTRTATTIPRLPMAANSTNV
jgi:hypothetical protein